MAMGPNEDNRSRHESSRGPDPIVPEDLGSFARSPIERVAKLGLYSEDSAERRRAAIEMCYTGDNVHRDEPGLIEIVRRGEKERAFDPAVCALGCSGSVEATKVLLELFRNRDELTVVGLNTVLTALGRCKAGAAMVIPELRPIVDDDSKAYGGHAKSALHELCNSIRPAHRSTERASENHIDILGEFGPGGTRVSDVPTRSLPRRSTGLLEDVRFPFVDGYGLTSECRLRIYRGADSNPVVAFTTDEHSYGQSVVNSIERLATAVATIYQLNPKKVTWVQHYASGCYPTGREDFAFVTLDKDFLSKTMSNPRWSHVGRRDVLEVFAARGIDARF